MSKLLNKTTHSVTKGLATSIAEKANGGMTLVELACESGYFADLNPSEIREQITSDLERKVAAHLVKYHGWAKVQRLEDGRKVSRFYQPSARMVTPESSPTGYTPKRQSPRAYRSAIRATKSPSKAIFAPNSAGLLHCLPEKWP